VALLSIGTLPDYVVGNMGWKSRVRVVMTVLCGALASFACKAKTSKPAPATASAAATGAAEPSAPANLPEPSLDPLERIGGAPLLDGRKHFPGGFLSPGALLPPEADAFLSPGSSNQVVVQSAGSGDKARLGGPLAGPRKGELSLSVDAGPSSPPQWTLAAELRPEQSEAAPAIGIEFSELGILGEVRSDIHPETLRHLDAFRGVRLLLKLDARGCHTGVEAALSGQERRQELGPLLGQFEDAFNSVFAAFPEQPVGVGAKWEVRSRERFGNADTITFRFYEVVGLSGNRIEITYQSERFLARRTVPGPHGQDAEATDFVARGNGQLTVPTNESAPLSGRTVEQVKLKLRALGVADQGTESTVRIRTGFNFKPE
jgi:hypothetical protein